MDSKTHLAIFVIAASMVIATVSMAIPASADKSDAREGLDKADEEVHDNTPDGLAGDEDVRFHEGLCQGGHSTSVLDTLDGCDTSIITEPGESENKP